MSEIVFDKFEKQVFLNTVLIENLTDGETGTGFLMLKKVDEEHLKFLLFSNKHVFWGKKDKDKKDIEKIIKLTLHKNNDDGKYVPGNVCEIKGKIYRDSGKGYYEHPDTEVDVACINISKVNERGLSLNILGLGEDFFEYEVDDLHAGMKVIFVGYPSGFYDKANKLPVLRSGTIGSIPTIKFNDKPQILLDAQVFPGSSGSPVFASIKGKYRLLGIVSDGIHKNIDFVEFQKTTDENVVSIPREWIGLGLLFTYDTIKTVYELA